MSLLATDHKKQGFTINCIPSKYLNARFGIHKSIRSDLLNN